MKYLFFLLILLSLEAKAQSIDFISYGDMDKPLPEIEILIDETGLNPCGDAYKKEKYGLHSYRFYVTPGVFKTLAHFVITQDSKAISNKVEKPESDYGAYKVSYIDDGKTIEYFFESGKYSSIFFRKFLPLCKSNDWLYEEIAVLIKRLD